MNWVVLLTVYIQIYGIYGKHRLWMEILNKCFEDNIKIEKVQPIGFFVVESENLKFQHAPCKTKAKRKRQATCRETKKHAEAFLNRYDFAYAGRDTVNQAAKVTLCIIKAATNEISNIAQQIISQGGKEIECVLPKILR